MIRAALQHQLHSRRRGPDRPWHLPAAPSSGTHSMLRVTMIIAQTPPSHIHGGFLVISLTGITSPCSVIIIKAARQSHATIKLSPAVMNGDLKNLLASVLILACSVEAMPAITPVIRANNVIPDPFYACYFIQLSSEGSSLNALSLSISPAAI